MPEFKVPTVVAVPQLGSFEFSGFPQAKASTTAEKPTASSFTGKVVQSSGFADIERDVKSSSQSIASVQKQMENVVRTEARQQSISLGPTAYIAPSLAPIVIAKDIEKQFEALPQMKTPSFDSMKISEPELSYEPKASIFEPLRISEPEMLPQPKFSPVVVASSMKESEFMKESQKLFTPSSFKISTGLEQSLKQEQKLQKSLMTPELQLQKTPTFVPPFTPTKTFIFTGTAIPPPTKPKFPSFKISPPKPFTTRRFVPPSFPDSYSLPMRKARSYNPLSYQRRKVPVGFFNIAKLKVNYSRLGKMKLTTKGLSFKAKKKRKR